MKIQDIIRIAFYHLNERRRQSFLTASGVAIGCAMLITTISVATGSSTNIREKIVDTSPHVSIFPRLSIPRIPENLLTDTTKHGFALVEKNITSSDKQTIKAYTEIVATAEAMKEVEVVSPFVMAKLIVRNKTRFKPCIARAVIPEREARVISLEKILMSGSVEELSYTPNGVMLGDMLAEDLRANYRTRLDLVTEKGEVFPVIVVGRFRSGFSEFDKKMAYINLRLGQRIEGLSQSTVTGIGIRTYNIDDSREVARRMEKLTGYETESWDETQKNVLAFIRRNNSVTLVLVGFVFIVAGLGVSSVMTTVVLQKTKDIAIMRSIGISRRAVTMIFMLEGLLIGVAGAIFGSVLGHLICDFVSTIRFQASTAGVVRSDRINIVESMDAHIIVIIFAIVITVISALGPARRAAKLEPVRVLRGEVA